MRFVYVGPDPPPWLVLAVVALLCIVVVGLAFLENVLK